MMTLTYFTARSTYVANAFEWEKMVKCYLMGKTYWKSANLTGSDSVKVRAFASEAGGAGSNPDRVIPKTFKMVPVATLLGAQH